ncbi:MAG: TlpA family protein disulfide reductase [Acidobacteria bacterium]|nr:TlpA family protein disulfide reductase [Acidobacteriota bacterium]
MKQKSASFLEAGARFPDFNLPADDRRSYNLSMILEKAPAALFAVFKTDCPTSQFSLPYFNRLITQIQQLPFIGISQDDRQSTSKFLKEWGTRFTLVLYEEDPYALSDALGVASVPALFLVGAQGQILASDYGYSAKFWEALAQAAGRACGVNVAPIVPANAPQWALG